MNLKSCKISWKVFACGNLGYQNKEFLQRKYIHSFKLVSGLFLLVSCKELVSMLKQAGSQ